MSERSRGRGYPGAIAANIVKLPKPWDTRNHQRPSLARRGAFGGEGLSAKLTGGEEPDAIREGVRVALTDCEAIFRAQEANKRMHACHALCRARIIEEMQRRKGTRIAEHLKVVLSIIDRQGP